MKRWKKKYYDNDESEITTSFDDAEPLISAGIAGFFRPLKVFITLSIISYFNESIYGCFMTRCDFPPYYHFPRIIAILSTIYFLIIALEERGDSGKHGKGHAKGVFFGTVFGILIFLFMSVIGSI